MSAFQKNERARWPTLYFISGLKSATDLNPHNHVSGGTRYLQEITITANSIHASYINKGNRFNFSISDRFM